MFCTFFLYSNCAYQFHSFFVKGNASKEEPQRIDVVHNARERHPPALMFRIPCKEEKVSPYVIKKKNFYCKTRFFYGSKKTKHYFWG